jgi:hypothetical protein
MLIIPDVCEGCQVMGLPSQIFAGIYFFLSKHQFFSREIFSEPSSTRFQVSNHFDIFNDAFKCTTIAYLRPPLTAVIYVSST